MLDRMQLPAALVCVASPRGCAVSETMEGTTFREKVPQIVAMLMALGVLI